MRRGEGEGERRRGEEGGGGWRGEGEEERRKGWSLCGCYGNTAVSSHQLLGQLPLLRCHGSGRLSGRSSGAVGAAEGGVSQPGHPRESVRTVWGRERRPQPVHHPGQGSAAQPADHLPDCSSLLTGWLLLSPPDSDQRGCRPPPATVQSRAELTPGQQQEVTGRKYGPR